MRRWYLRGEEVFPSRGEEVVSSQCEVVVCSKSEVLVSYRGEVVSSRERRWYPGWLRKRTRVRVRRHCPEGVPPSHPVTLELCICLGD